jgi:hypothetical protein
MILCVRCRTISQSFEPVISVQYPAFMCPACQLGSPDSFGKITLDFWMLRCEKTVYWCYNENTDHTSSPL